MVVDSLSRKEMTDLRTMLARLSLAEDGGLGCICVPNDKELRQSILKEAHSSPYAIHHDGNKMYRDLQELYWWLGLKWAPVKIPQWKWEWVTTDFVSGLPLTPIKKDLVWVIVDQLTKSAHFIPIRTDYSLQKLAKLHITEIGMLQSCVIDLRGSWEEYLPLAEFAYNNNFQSSSQMAPYEALYSCKFHTSLCWTKLSESRVLGLELVSEIENTVRLIQDRLKGASDRQNSYADLKRKGIEFSIGDQLELPSELELIHNVFHVLILRRYRSDPSHIIPVDKIELRPDLTFEKEPIQIIERDVKILRKKNVHLVKVIWRNHGIEEATWEPKKSIRRQYLYLFESGLEFELYR
ncbi:uncharacterized protein [Gossypium hirsutum]|uniref:Integrase zinc-binding domain-containing protein n=1 Tax=Gossypium hirsutum TaxID=3635 RepID=A0A1U8L1T9_GOSHI|nr:uncharacterized protein LOC107921686 [Gossypium hirsutum]